VRINKTKKAGSGFEPAHHHSMFGSLLPDQQRFQFEQILGEQIQDDHAGFRVASLFRDGQNQLIVR
jgi:hypothetical protein